MFYVYISCIIIGLIGSLKEFFIGEDQDVDGFHLSLGSIFFFLLGSGLGGILCLKFEFFSIIGALMSGLAFVFFTSFFMDKIRAFGQNHEEVISAPEKGMPCITLTNLNPGMTGSVKILIQGREYEYLAQAEEFIPINTECQVINFKNNLVVVK